jgi:protein TonB
VAAAGDGGNTAALRRLLEALQQAVRYPWAARRRGLEGTVVLSFRVSPEGVPVDVRVLRSSGHKMLDEAALRGLKRATPLPRVSGLLRVPISFRLSD